VHPIRSEGLLLLRPLLQSDDVMIREGIRAMLAEERIAFYRRESTLQSEHWTAWQWSDARLRQQLDGLQEELAPLEDAAAREAAREAFDRYAYQWY
jgi:hypothetical protein